MGASRTVECPVEIADEVCRLTEKVMKQAMGNVLSGDVPVEVEANACDCWDEK